MGGCCHPVRCGERVFEVPPDLHQDYGCLNNESSATGGALGEAPPGAYRRDLIPCDYCEHNPSKLWFIDIRLLNSPYYRLPWPHFLDDTIGPPDPFTAGHRLAGLAKMVLRPSQPLSYWFTYPVGVAGYTNLERKQDETHFVEKASYDSHCFAIKSFVEGRPIASCNRKSSCRAGF